MEPRCDGCGDTRFDDETVRVRACGHVLCDYCDSLGCNACPGEEGGVT
jgi:hypothetical protein